MDVFDVATEQPISLAEAVDYLPKKPSGKKLSIATITRWIYNGHRKVKLQAVKMGDALYTSKESLRRFAERCTTGKADVRSEAEISAETARAKKFLEKRRSTRGKHVVKH